MIVQIGRREEFDKKLLGEMHKLRAQVFKERKGWDVSVMGFGEQWNQKPT